MRARLGLLPALAVLLCAALLAPVSVLAATSEQVAAAAQTRWKLSPGAFMAALGVFGAFGALSIATWAFFRFRSKPGPAAEAA